MKFEAEHRRENEITAQKQDVLKRRTIINMVFYQATDSSFYHARTVQ
jgi:hypothetical protein